ncbi:hypothetical protein [Vreelandella titanicae]|uniref:hypothetical protein n=1 Tax=Vreelandella titanicae TaxID=664683 RepID=UPI003D2684B2
MRGLFGASIVSVSQILLPWGLAFAAGAMLYVISHEIIPRNPPLRAPEKSHLWLGDGAGDLCCSLDVWLG